MRYGTLVWLLIASTLSAGETKISFRQLTRTHPIAVQRGTTAQIQVHSNFTLDGSHSAFFAPAGPQLTYAETKPRSVDWADPEESDLGEAYRFQVTVPRDQLPGVYEYRIATDQAVSSVAHLLVTDHPVVVEKSGDNSTPQTAQPVSVPVAVSGIADDFEDVDCYRIAGKQGQTFVAQIYSQRVTRSIHCMAIEYPKLHLMDAMLTLFGPQGRVIAQNDNFYGGDSFLHCVLPADGDYILQVRDSRYTGDPRYVYCVEITQRPQAFGAFPLAVQRGKQSRVELVMSHPESLLTGGSDAAGLAAQTGSPAPPAAVTLTNAATNPLGWTTTRSGAPHVQPVQVLVSDHPQLQPPGTHTSRDAALALPLPVGISARFQDAAREHFYRFTAHKDRYYRFEVNSQRRGFAVDSVIAIYDAAGKQMAKADDGWFTKDATLDFQAPADGDYVLSVRDLNRRGGPRFAYHLSAAPSGPDFEVHGEYYYGMLAATGHAIWFVKLKRLNGFNGPVEMRVQGLPQGVSFTPVTIPSGMNHCGLIFTAAADAKINAALVRVTGHATVNDGNGKQIALERAAHVTCELRRAGASRFYRSPIRTQLLGVTKPLDVTSVTATPQSVTLAPGGSATITVHIQRNPAYKDQVLLDMAFSFFSTKFGEQLPPGVSLDASSQTKLTGDTLQGTIVLKAAPNAASVTRHPLAVLARVPITYSIMTNYASNPVLLTVAPPKTPPSKTDAGGK